MAEQLEACAEATSALEHVVPVFFLAYSHFCTDFLGPLLTESLKCQTKNEHLFPVCISDPSTNKVHTKYRPLCSGSPPEYLSPNPYLAAQARARLPIPISEVFIIRV